MYFSHCVLPVPKISSADVTPYHHWIPSATLSSQDQTVFWSTQWSHILGIYTAHILDLMKVRIWVMWRWRLLMTEVFNRGFHPKVSSSSSHLLASYTETASQFIQSHHSSKCVELHNKTTKQFRRKWKRTVSQRLVWKVHQLLIIISSHNWKWMSKSQFVQQIYHFSQESSANRLWLLLICLRWQGYTKYFMWMNRGQWIAHRLMSVLIASIFPLWHSSWGGLDQAQVTTDTVSFLK